MILLAEHDAEVETVPSVCCVRTGIDSVVEEDQGSPAFLPQPPPAFSKRLICGNTTFEMTTS